MSDTSQRQWRFYLDEMIKFAEKVLDYTAELEQTAFLASGLTGPHLSRSFAAAHSPHR